MNPFKGFLNCRPVSFPGSFVWGCVWLLVAACAHGNGGPIPAPQDSVRLSGAPPGPRVAVVVFEDDRPPGEKDPSTRIEAGDDLYPYYSYDTERERVSFQCGFLGSCTAFREVTHRIPEEAAERLLREGISNGSFSPGSRIVPGPPDWPSDRLRALSVEGIEILVLGKLENLYGMAYHPVEPLSTLIGWSLKAWSFAKVIVGPDIHVPRHQVYGLARLSEIRIIDLKKGVVLWEGPVEAGVERTDTITSSRGAADEALQRAIVEIINEFNMVNGANRS